MLAHATEEFLAAATTGPSETQFWQTLTPILEGIDQHAAFALAGNIDCKELANLAADANRLALCAYLQGFYDLAWSITSDQIRVLKAVVCPCARICEVQPWVNLARLARAMLEPVKLDKALAGLRISLDRALTTDPSSVPVDASVSLVDGSIAKAAQHVGTIEQIKFSWLTGDFVTCEKLARPIAEVSSVAMEFTVRGLIELGRLDEAISLTATFISRFSWLAAYAVIALLRGGAYAEALQVLAAIKADYALPLLRVATELAHAGLPNDAARVGIRIAHSSISSGQEVPAQLAVTFLLANGKIVPDDLREEVMRAASTSQHYPSVILLYLAVAFRNGNDGTNEVVLECANLIHPMSLPNSIRTFSRSSAPPSITGDFVHNCPSRIVESRSATSSISSHLLQAMSAHK